MTRKTEHLVHPNERMKIAMSRQRARPGLETEARRGGKRGGGSGGRTTRGTGKTTDGDADGTDERDERKAREKRRQTASARASSGDGDEKEFKGTRGELVDSTATPRWDVAVKENKNLEFIKKSSEELIQSRPTAINLKWAVDRMMKKLSGINNDQLLDTALNEAKKICDEDEKFCESIGVNGLKII